MTRNRHNKIATIPKSDPLWEKIAADVAPRVPDEVSHVEYSNGHVAEVKSKLSIRTKQIAIGVPMDELMFSKFFSNFFGLNIMPWDNIITTASTYLPEARNQIHDIFLEKVDGSHLLMLDSDVLPPPDFITRMLKHDKPIVGGVYLKKERYPIKDVNGKISYIQRPVVYDYVGKRGTHEEYTGRLQLGTGLEKVDAAGAGCWLMRRDVAEAIGKSPYSMEHGGEDMELCRKVIAAGFDIYVDWDAKCAHVGVTFA